jgi:hypothetical protein
MRASETLVSSCETTLRYNPEDSHLRTHRRENLKSYLDLTNFDMSYKTSLQSMLKQLKNICDHQVHLRSYLKHLYYIILSNEKVFLVMSPLFQLCRCFNVENWTNQNSNCSSGGLTRAVAAVNVERQTSMCGLLQAESVGNTVVKLLENGHWEDLGAEGRVALKLILEK